MVISFSFPPSPKLGEVIRDLKSLEAVSCASGAWPDRSLTALTSDI